MLVLFVDYSVQSDQSFGSRDFIEVHSSLGQTVTAVNLSLVRLDQRGKRSTLSSLQYENSCLLSP